MSTAGQPMEYEPDEKEAAVLGVIRREKRVNPLRVREETELRKQYVNDALRGLQKAGVVRKVNRGLYEHVPENDDVVAVTLEDALDGLNAATRYCEARDLDDLAARAGELYQDVGEHAPVADWRDDG